MRNITQKMIASEAKVSQALVSLILAENANPDVPASKRRVRVTVETRQRVLETSARLGYHGRVGSRSADISRDQSLALLRLAPSAADGELSPEVCRIEESWQKTLQNALIEAASRMGFTLNFSELPRSGALAGKFANGRSSFRQSFPEHPREVAWDDAHDFTLRQSSALLRCCGCGCGGHCRLCPRAFTGVGSSQGRFGGRSSDPPDCRSPRFDLQGMCFLAQHARCGGVRGLWEREGVF